MKKEKHNENEKREDSLHEDYHEEHKVNTKNKKSKMQFSSSNVLIAAVAVLVIIAGVQVFQTQQLLRAVSSGSLKVNAQQTQGNSIGLPSQVGGCG